MRDSSFRVIVIGAGPTGLYIARALLAAGIDFIVLEQGPPTFLERGNHLMVWPHTARLLHQLGLYEEAKRRSYELSSKVDMLSDGRVIEKYDLWEKMKESHGYTVLSLQRCQLLEILYHSLPDREKYIITGAKVTRIEKIDGGVQVQLADGTTEVGSIIIGADGIHGIAKSYVQKATSKATVDSSNGSATSIPSTSHFQSIFAEGVNTLGIKSGIFYETRGNGKAIQMGSNGELVRLVLYKQLPEPSAYPAKYTKEQMEEVSQSFFDMSAGPGVTIRDIWSEVFKDSARLVNQYEYFAEHWYTDRVVLTGDAAVTISSMTGLGLNSGLQSAALLASELQKAVSSSGGNPDEGSLTAAFARYQRLRAKALRPIYDYAHLSIRQTTWCSWKDWFVDRFLIRWIGADAFRKAYIHPIILHGQILSYVPFKDLESPSKWRWNPDILRGAKA